MGKFLLTFTIIFSALICQAQVGRSFGLSSGFLVNTPVKTYENNYNIAFYKLRARADHLFYDFSKLEQDSMSHSSVFYPYTARFFYRKDFVYFDFLDFLKPRLTYNLDYYHRGSSLDFHKESEFVNDTMWRINARLQDVSDVISFSIDLDFRLVAWKFFRLYAGLHGGYGIAVSSRIYEDVTKSYYSYNPEFPGNMEPMAENFEVIRDDSYTGLSYLLVHGSFLAGMDFRFYKKWHFFVQYQYGYLDEASFSSAKMGYKVVTGECGFVYDINPKQALKEENPEE